MENEAQKANPVVMHFNTALFNSEENKWKRLLNYLQELRNAYSKLELGLLEIKEIASLLENPEEFIFVKMTKGAPIIFAGLKVTPAKAREIFEMPPGFDDLKKIVDKTNNDLTRNIGNMSGPTNTNDFETNSEGEIIIKQTLIDKLRGSMETRAESDFAKGAYNLASTLLDSLKQNKTVLDGLLSPGVDPPNKFRDFFYDLIIYDSENREFIVNHAKISVFNRKLKWTSTGLPHYE